eukprot:TRINITY_DN4872_c0_g1_i1.p1 TRINITY_DN4872_c0_g1~~TRINITY_DN4872_c0_g1_i1.p1  ORF type:complete len:306 (+),score=50.71 TRINITY_DN4872_c0_g1_i1:60-977(+)
MSSLALVASYEDSPTSLPIDEVSNGTYDNGSVSPCRAPSPSPTSPSSTSPSPSSTSPSPSSTPETQLPHPLPTQPNLNEEKDYVTFKHARHLLPPEPSGAPVAEVQEKIRAFLQKSASFNQNLTSMRLYKNPSILEKIVCSLNIDQIGSNYPSHLYDPHAFSDADFYEAIAQKRADLDEMERKNRDRIEFARSATQQPPVLLASSGLSASTSMPPPALPPSSVSSSANPSSSSSTQPTLSRRRSKWDQASGPSATATATAATNPPVMAVPDSAAAAPTTDASKMNVLMQKRREVEAAMQDQKGKQ